MKRFLAMTIKMLTSSVGAAEVGGSEAMVTEKRAKAAVIEHSTEAMGTISYRRADEQRGLPISII